MSHNPNLYSDRQMRTLQQPLRSHRLQRNEAELADTGEAQAHGTGLWAHGQCIAGIPFGPLRGCGRPPGGARHGPWGLRCCPWQQVSRKRPESLAKGTSSMKEALR